MSSLQCCGILCSVLAGERTQRQGWRISVGTGVPQTSWGLIDRVFLLLLRFVLFCFGFEVFLVVFVFH